jgi:hypothetical protein
MLLETQLNSKKSYIKRVFSSKKGPLLRYWHMVCVSI